MKKLLETIITATLQQLIDDQILAADFALPVVNIDPTKDPKHGDFASNIALVLAKHAKMNPRALAEKIVTLIGDNPQIKKIQIAGPGFINFYISDTAYHAVLVDIIQQDEDYGRSDIGKGKKIQVEFVSANPTGPLHVGHGRGAAYGAVVADLLETIGYQVEREYYVNDAGRQMDILATSVWLRYLELCDATLTFPQNAYKGDYVWDIAAILHRQNGQDFYHHPDLVFSDIYPDEMVEGGDKEKHIDDLIAKAKVLLADQYQIIFKCALETILADIKDDLSLFGVDYQNWYSEQVLVDSGKVDSTIKRLQDQGVIYEKNGALWFKSTDYGDEKDRVVVRDNGQKTYFASDIAYHLDKLDRGFDQMIDVWGADHHGYIPRVRAALTASGQDQNKLDVLLVQFANLYRNGEKIAMSTRSGSFVTLRELRKDVGKDAARFFYAMRRCEQHLDFDLDLAKSKSRDNPVYYVQYAHARICSTFAKATDLKLSVNTMPSIDYLEHLTTISEQRLIKQLAKYKSLIESAALQHEPHQLTHYLRDLARDLHAYYDKDKFLVDDENIRKARMKLIFMIKLVLRNGLALLGVSAPEQM